MGTADVFKNLRHDLQKLFSTDLDAKQMFELTKTDDQAAADVNPAMTGCERKLTRKPSLNKPMDS
jgi:hypothetical protein